MNRLLTQSRNAIFNSSGVVMHRAGVLCLKADRGSAGPVTIPLMVDVSCASSAG